MIIFINHFTYNDKNNFIELPFEGYTFKKSIDIFKILDHLSFKIIKKNSSLFNNLYFRLTFTNKRYHF